MSHLHSCYTNSTQRLLVHISLHTRIPYVCLFHQTLHSLTLGTWNFETIFTLCVMSHMSCVTCNMSNVLFHKKKLQCRGASMWKVCYQWSLPCLVFMNYYNFFWIVHQDRGILEELILSISLSWMVIGRILNVQCTGNTLIQEGNLRPPYTVQCTLSLPLYTVHSTVHCHVHCTPSTQSARTV